MISEKWCRRFLELAENVSQWSKDPSTKCGAVLVRPDKSIASTGFNGLPPNIQDEDKYLIDRELKYKVIRHAEENCISFCRDQSLEGYAMFVYPFQPCSNCMSEIASNGIARVVTYVDRNPRWKESFEIGRMIASDCGIELTFMERD